MVIGTYLSIITLHVNGLNAQNKRHRLAEWTEKQDPYICCVQESHGHIETESEGVEKDIPSKWKSEEN